MPAAAPGAMAPSTFSTSWNLQVESRARWDDDAPLVAAAMDEEKELGLTCDREGVLKLLRRATLAALLLLRVAAPRPLGSKAARVAAPRPPPKRALPKDCANNTLIFGVGLPKSGTRSLGAAASALGITSAKGMTKGEHGVEYGFRKHLIPFAAGSANASNPLRRLDEHAWATSTLYTDFPFYALSCALAAAYPRALFVDVRRDCDAWVRASPAAAIPRTQS